MKTHQMKKIIFANNIVTVVQLSFIALSVIFNFITDDSKVFLISFVHVGIYVLYNIVVENIVEYGYLDKKYAELYAYRHPLEYLKFKKRIYKIAKANGDKVSCTLILQSFIKTMLILTNIILMVLMVRFQ